MNIHDSENLLPQTRTELRKDRALPIEKTLERVSPKGLKSDFSAFKEPRSLGSSTLSATAGGANSAGGGNLQQAFPKLKLLPEPLPGRKEKISELLRNGHVKSLIFTWAAPVWAATPSHAVLRAVARLEPNRNVDRLFERHGYRYTEKALQGPYLASSRALSLDGVEKDAVTFFNPDIETLFNLERLARYAIPERDVDLYLAVLGLHELCRNLNIYDEDYRVSKLIWKYPPGKRLVLWTSEEYSSDRSLQAYLVVLTELQRFIKIKKPFCLIKDGPDAGKQTPCPGVSRIDLSEFFSLHRRAATRFLRAISDRMKDSCYQVSSDGKPFWLPEHPEEMIESGNGTDVGWLVSQVVEDFEKSQNCN